MLIHGVTTDVDALRMLYIVCRRSLRVVARGKLSLRVQFDVLHNPQTKLFFSVCYFLINEQIQHLRKHDIHHSCITERRVYVVGGAARAQHRCELC